MEKHLEILIVEDDPVKAWRLTEELTRNGILFHSRLVQRREEFMHALGECPPDLILADDALSTFNGFAALDLARERCPKVPFVFVTGSCEQGRLVEMFDGGALGWVYRHRLNELVPVIRQALEEVQAEVAAAEAERRQKEANEEPTARRQTGPESAVAQTPIEFCPGCRRVRNELHEWESIETYLRRSGCATVTLGVCPVCATAVRPDPRGGPV